MGGRFKPAFAERDKKQTMTDLRGISSNCFKNQFCLKAFKFIGSEVLDRYVLDKYMCKCKERHVRQHPTTKREKKILKLHTKIILLIRRENPAKIPVWQKIRQSIPHLIQFYRATAGGTVNIHVFQVRLKQRKVSSHPPSSISPSTSSPSTIPPSPNPPSRPLGQFDY